tara:strand:- start:163 stop:879 length:717 start_codon:yes stop_codon:yes gene_type:complete
MKHIAILFFIFISWVTAGEKPQKITNSFATTLRLEVSLNYNLYFPKDYQYSANNYPLVLFLHGAGDRGDNLNMVEAHGIPKIIMEGENFPFVTLAPQCPKFQYWPEPVNVATLIQLVEAITEKYRIDKNRVYATGLSMGGYGTLSIAKERPDLFAGIISVCGGLDTTNIEKLKDMPIWLFHGSEDKVVPPENSKIIYEALKNINSNIYMTIYPNVNHNSWDITYSNQEIYKWLMKHKK